jgi:hypothetical protein
MLLHILLTLFSLFQRFNAQHEAVGANGITLQKKIEAMDRQILSPLSLNSLVSPCDFDIFNFTNDPKMGEQTSA